RLWRKRAVREGVSQHQGVDRGFEAVVFVEGQQRALPHGFRRERVVGKVTGEGAIETARACAVALGGCSPRDVELRLRGASAVRVLGKHALERGQRGDGIARAKVRAS